MPFIRFIFLSFIGSFLTTQVSAQTLTQADELKKLCPLPNIATMAPTNTNIDLNALNISSLQTKIIKNKSTEFSGEVTLFKNEYAIAADRISVNRETSTMNAQGDIHFQIPGVDVFAQFLTANEVAQTTQLTDASYQLANNPGHGSASSISISANGTLSLIDSSFTTCYEEVPDWILQASEINISTENNHGEAINARFKLFDVPVMYIPYFSFPVNNNRKSGFLYPKIGESSNSGVSIELPYYWNIADNLDATITPKYMSKRGTQLLTEFRYLADFQNGALNIEYLHDDNQLKSNNDPRYLARWQHVGNFSENYRAYIDFTTISDDNYLVDIGSDQYNANDAYLYQVAELAYFGDDWQAKILMNDFEVLGDNKTSYKTSPQIELSSVSELPFLNGQFDIYSEIARFTSDDVTLPEADRYHIEAGATFPFSSPAWFLNSEFRLMQTHYRQSREENHPQIEKNVSRTLPKIRFHGGINLDRKITLFDNPLTQSLEPQLQYLYIPNKDQSNINVYDTTELQDDYNGLFRDRRFSGLDRIAQANQYAWGLTSRLLDNNNQELFTVSLGRIVYLNESNLVSNDNSSVEKSALASEIFFQINRQWQFSSDIQYNTRENNTNKSQTTLDYYINKNNTIQLNHRYTRNVSGKRIEQVSLLTNFPVNKDWQFVGRITQDLRNKRSIDSYAGLQYESCCWGIRFAFHRNINSNLDQQDFINENRDEFDSGFMVQFVIKGLGGGKRTLNTDEMFNNSIFGYKRPYFLNN